MFKIIGNIIKKVAKQPVENKRSKKTKTKKAMPKTKLTAEQKAARRKKIKEAISKGAKLITTYEGGKPIVKVKPAPKTETLNFFDKEINLGIIKPTGKQFLIGSGITLLTGTILYKAFK